MEISIGRMVHYHLHERDVERIRQMNGSGNHHYVGQIIPLIVVVVWKHEFGEGKPGVNGQAILDGDSSLWVTSAGEGTEPGQWSWPPRV